MDLVVVTIVRVVEVMVAMVGGISNIVGEGAMTGGIELYLSK